MHNFELSVFTNKWFNFNMVSMLRRSPFIITYLRLYCRISSTALSCFDGLHLVIQYPYNS